jgi:hypothetical protein
MRRRLAAVRTAVARFLAWYDVAAALAYHHAMGHSCSFCRPESKCTERDDSDGEVTGITGPRAVRGYGV